jgi:hypothetical protein
MVIYAATRCSSVMTLTCVLWTPTGRSSGRSPRYCERGKLVVQLDRLRPAVDLARLAGVDGLDELEILRQRSAGENRDDVRSRTLPQTRLTTRDHAAQHDSDVWVHKRLRKTM